jgi:hypothetical protein
MGRYVACIGAKRNAYRILVGEPEGKRLLGRPRLCGRIILRYDGGRTGFIWLRLVPIGGGLLLIR